MSSPYLKVDHNLLNKLMNFVRDYGCEERNYYKVLRSNEYTLRWSRGYEIDELDIKLKEDKEEIWRCADEAKIERFLPNTFIHGDFYKAISMAREIFTNDPKLYIDIINRKNDFN